MEAPGLRTQSPEEHIFLEGNHPFAKNAAPLP